MFSPFYLLYFSTENFEKELCRTSLVSVFQKFFSWDKLHDNVESHKFLLIKQRINST